MKLFFYILGSFKKVHLIKKQSIENYAIKNARSKPSFEKRLALLKSADILGKGTKRVIFNIGGNHYRMICKYQFGKSKVHLFIKWIGTHAEYSNLCNEGTQYEVDVY